MENDSIRSRIHPKHTLINHQFYGNGNSFSPAYFDRLQKYKKSNFDQGYFLEISSLE